MSVDGERNKKEHNLGEDIPHCKAWTRPHVTWRQEVSHATDIAILDVGILSAYQVLMVTCEHNDPCFIACTKYFAAWESNGSYDEDRIFANETGRRPNIVKLS